MEPATNRGMLHIYYSLYALHRTQGVLHAYRKCYMRDKNIKQYWQVPPPTHKSPLTNYEKGQWGKGGNYKICPIPKRLSQRSTNLNWASNQQRDVAWDYWDKQVIPERNDTGGSTEAQVMQVLYSLYILIYIIHNIGNILNTVLYYKVMIHIWCWTVRELHTVGTYTKWLCFIM